MPDAVGLHEAVLQDLLGQEWVAGDRQRGRVDRPLIGVEELLERVDIAPLHACDEPVRLLGDDWHPVFDAPRDESYPSPVVFVHTRPWWTDSRLGSVSTR